LFSLIALPHRNDVSGAGAWRPDHHHHAPGEVSDRLHADLAVVAPAIPDIQRAAGEDVQRVGEVERPLGKGLVPLGAMERDPHRDLLYTRNIASLNGGGRGERP
jgi:hypothetical protein